MSETPVYLHKTGHGLINVKMRFNKIISQQVGKCLQGIAFLAHLSYCPINFSPIFATDL